MSKAEEQAAKVLGPKAGEVAVVAITTSSAVTDMSAAAQLGPNYEKELITLIASVDTWYVWGGSGDTVDETATSGDTRASFLAAGVPVHEFARDTHLVIKGSAAGYLRAYISSR